MTALPATPFWFLRHGETDYNARGLSQGALDIPLNDTGRRQAAEAGATLAGQAITTLVCSPMLRTRETADIVNRTLRLPISYEPDLREVVFGGMEGQPLMPWFPDWLAGTMTPPGAETFAALTQRVATAMQRVLTLPGCPLIVSHGGVFRAVRDLMGLPREGLTANGVPMFCWFGDGGWRVRAAV